jgi:hypothetical protein
MSVAAAGVGLDNTSQPARTPKEKRGFMHSLWQYCIGANHVWQLMAGLGHVPKLLVSNAAPSTRMMHYMGHEQPAWFCKLACSQLGEQ